MEPINRKYNFLKPIKTPNLIRFGGKFDGGYVVDSKIIKKCNNLITFGLGPNWLFELDYLRQNIFLQRIFNPFFVMNIYFIKCNCCIFIFIF